MIETCAKCVLIDKIQANDDILTCHQCSKNVHGHCAGVEPLLYEFLIASNNLSWRWRCDDCIGIPAKVEINDCLGVIMGKLVAMSSDNEALKANTAPKTPSADLFRRDGTPISIKRCGGGEGPSSVNRSRVETPKVIVGTGAANNALIPVELDDNVKKINASTDEKIAALKQHIKEYLLTKINANEAAITEHNQRINHLEADIETLKDALEKSAKANDFTIKGIPILPNVQPRPLYLKIVSAIGYCLNTTPPADAFRLGKTKVGAKFDPPHDSLSEP
jgi:hypothetical protein